MARDFALADRESLVRDWQLGERKKAVSGDTTTLIILIFSSMVEYKLVEEHFSKSNARLRNDKSQREAPST